MISKISSPVLSKLGLRCLTLTFVFHLWRNILNIRRNPPANNNGCGWLFVVWSLPRSPFGLPGYDHPHRPESHQQSPCPLSSFQKHFWCSPGSRSTGGKASLTYWGNKVEILWLCISSADCNFSSTNIKTWLCSENCFVELLPLFVFSIRSCLHDIKQNYLWSFLVVFLNMISDHL